MNRVGIFFASLSLFLAVALSLSGAEAGEVEIEPTEVQATPIFDPTSYRLIPGDELTIEVFNQKALNGKYKLSEAGDIDFPLLGKIRCAGLSIAQVQSQIQSLLNRDYFVDPQVQITLTQSSSLGKVYISGAIKSPGAYSYEKGLTALNAVILAGGFTDIARPNKTKIIRKDTSGKTIKININLKSVLRGKAEDVPLNPGDKIIIPESLF